MSKAKRKALLLLSLTAVLILILAMSLQNLALSPGEPFVLANQSASQGVSSAGESNLLGWLFRGAVALIVVLFPVYIVYSLMTNQGRRRLLANLIMLALFLLIADRLPKLEQEQEQEAQEIMLPDPAEMGADGSIPVAVFPETPPPWITLVVILAAAGLLLALLAITYWLYWQRQPKPDVHLEALAETAHQTIESIHSGGDLKTSVIACYREMSRVVQEQRGIARDAAMTPREFEEVLIRRGLPGEAIRTLTRLFESVRYGSMATGAQEEAQAVACLTEIAQACRNIGGAYARR